MSKHTFQTEVNRLLHLMIHSLYSNQEIFLRELVSNASDALDKLKYLTMTEAQYKSIAFDPLIEISFDEGAKKLVIKDNGIGMNEEDLVANLGTIASSGTKHFVESMSGDSAKDSSLIGQFGVGFYSSFMVADQVEVISRKAGEDQAFKWTSDGKGEYEIAPAERAIHGTTITMALNESGSQFANRWKIEDIIKKYSNHIPFPIFIEYSEKKYDNEGKDTGEVEQKREQVNQASAIWKKQKGSLKPEDYHEFYKVISHDSEDPFHYVHTHAEGNLLYTTLFFIPKKAPFDLYRMDYKPGVKLYVKRVFITDEEKELLPTYLRFVRGIIDSEDLPLNVSREILQENRILASIKSASVKKVLSELETLAKDPEKYNAFISEFGRPIKEGLYQDYANKEKLLELVRFKSSSVDGWRSLSDYVTNMKPDQKVIYYISGEKENVLRRSPLLAPFKAKGIEVLVMDDEIDEIVMPTVGKYHDYELKPITHSDAASDLKSDEDKQSEAAAEPIIGKIKSALGDAIKDVRASAILGESPSAIVNDEKDPSFQMQHIMKAMGQGDMGEIKPILEINPSHEIVKKLEGEASADFINDVSWLLLDEALLLAGMEMKNPSEFASRLNRILARAL